MVLLFPLTNLHIFLINLKKVKSLFKSILCTHQAPLKVLEYEKEVEMLKSGLRV